MSHYRAAIISNNGLDFEDLIDRYREDNEKYYQRYPVNNIYNKFNKFRSDNPTCDWSLGHWAQEFGYKKDKDGWYYMAHPDPLFDWHTPYGGEYILEDYINEWPDILKISDIDWEKWENGDCEIPYLYITPDGEIVSPGRVWWFALSTDTEESFEEYKKMFFTIPEKYKEGYMRIDDFHI